MITVITDPQSENPSDPIENIQIKALNLYLEGFGDIVAEKISKIQCESHPNGNQKLRLSITSDKKIHAEMTHFCCTTFKYQIESTIH